LSRTDPTERGIEPGFRQPVAELRNNRKEHRDRKEVPCFGFVFVFFAFFAVKYATAFRISDFGFPSDFGPSDFGFLTRHFNPPAPISSNF
jgi:hypothetical protein